LLDHIFMTMITMVFFIPAMISIFVDAFNITHEQTSPNLNGGNWIYLSILGFAFYFCKDCIKGRSIAKRLLGLQVVDNSNGKVASPLQCFVRNLFTIIWPIEFLMALSNPGRRIGDRVAGTKLVMFDPTLEQPTVDIFQVLISVATAYVLIFIGMLPFKGLMSSIEAQKIKYVETSFNRQSSKELELLLHDSLQQYLTPSVKIFDKTKNADLKYISAIMQLRNNYLEDEGKYEKLNALTTTLIYSVYPKGTFTGQLKYIYKSSGHMQSRTMGIGTSIRTDKRNNAEH
ncbi:MAG TPA: RDD family protein, partial [Cytophagales bacterium]|nr:RDD family protein [Cytophagales bacterium]